MRSLGLCRNVAPKEFSEIGHKINLEDTFMCKLDDNSVVLLGKVSLCEESGDKVSVNGVKLERGFLFH